MRRTARPQTDTLDDLDDDLTIGDELEDPRPRRRRERGVRADERGPRRGMKRSVMHVITQIPSYVRLLVGLVGDRRVSRIDRFLVLAAVVYIVSPLDFIPDVIPFLGQVDDIFLLMTALQRMVERAGFTVLLDHWRGDPEELESLHIPSVVSAAAFFLPPQLRRRLRRLAGQRR
jgi:uncharacterized membrane protein YkvA (DUF1232 family)